MNGILSYQITLSNGTPVATIYDRSVDHTTSLSLIGRGSVEFGTAVLENFVYLLENFSNNAPPQNPLVGQCWFDTTVGILKIYYKQSWHPVSDNGVFGVTGLLAQGPLITGEISGNARISGTIGLVLYAGSGATTVSVTFAEGQIVFASSNYHIPFVDLPLTVSVSGFTIPFSGLFPNGLVPGVNLAQTASNLVYAGSQQFAQLLASVPYLLVGDDHGTANVVQITVPAVLDGYHKYLTIETIIANTNNGPTTLNINHLGAKPVVRRDGSAIQAGDLQQGGKYALGYDGTSFRIETLLTIESNAISLISGIQVQVGANTAAILTEESVRADAVSAVAETITTLTATVANNTAQIVQEAIARANGDSAMAQTVTSLTATVQTQAGQVQALFNQITTTQADQNGVLADQITTLQGQYGDALAKIQIENATRASADSAIASQLTQLQANYAGNSATISLNATVAANANSVLASQLLTLKGTVDQNSAQLSVLSQLNVSQINSTVQQVITLTAQTGQNTASLQTEVQARTSADSALSTQFSNLQTSVNGSIATLQQSYTTYSDNVTAVSTTVSNLSATVGQNTAAIGSLQTAYANSTSASASQISGLQAQVGQNTAAITNNQTVQATVNGSFASDIQTLQSQGSTNSATLSQIKGTVDGVSVQYGITGSINGQTGGFIFSGVKQLDGSVVYDMEFDTNVSIHGNLLVGGSIGYGAIGGDALSGIAANTLAPVFAPTGNIQTFLSSANWTCPAGIGRVFVRMWGGGGGGGGSSTPYGGGSGGGGGEYREGYVAVTPGQTYYVAVGFGGAGGTNAPTNGGYGGLSGFGNLMIAGSGTGGSLIYYGYTTPFAGSGGTGGAGGTGFAGHGGAFSYGIGAGFGSVTPVSGLGGAPGMYGTVNSINVGASAVVYPGAFPGGGGNGSSGGGSGGDGAQGMVILTW